MLEVKKNVPPPVKTTYDITGLEDWQMALIVQLVGNSADGGRLNGLFNKLIDVMSFNESTKFLKAPVLIGIVWRTEKP